MQLGGWQYPIRERDWTDLLTEYQCAVESMPTLVPLVSIIESVIQNHMQHKLAATTSMWDLVVTMAPPGEPPLDVVIVRSAASMNPSAPGRVRIQHLATSGLKEEVTRPVPEALPLFWRFVLEKYGLQPSRPKRTDADSGREGHLPHGPMSRRATC